MNTLNVLVLILILTFLAEISLYLVYTGFPLFVIYVGVILSIPFFIVLKSRD